MEDGLEARFRAHHDALVKAGKIGVLVPAKGGNIPVLYSRGANLPEAWENALVNVWLNGCDIRTQYDEKGPDGSFLHSPSKDSTMVMVVEEPLSEPYIHRCFPGGLEDLEEYRQEVIDGIKDHWVRDPNDPNDKRWEYTYHERMVSYRVPGLKEAIDQFELMAQNLAKSPITRRAQMISWKPWEDSRVDDPACWQSYWGRILADEAGKPVLNLNMRFRSRDAFKAAFMNDFAFILLGKKLAARISQLRGEEVRLGRFIDESDSFHVYGSYFSEFQTTFIRQVVGRTFEARTWRSDSDEVRETFEESKAVIAEKVRQQDEKYSKR
jgi:thymidylate synthase